MFLSNQILHFIKYPIWSILLSALRDSFSSVRIFIFTRFYFLQHSPGPYGQYFFRYSGIIENSSESECPMENFTFSPKSSKSRPWISIFDATFVFIWRKPFHLPWFFTPVGSLKHGTLSRFFRWKKLRAANFFSICDNSRAAQVFCYFISGKFCSCTAPTAFNEYRSGGHYEPPIYWTERVPGPHCGQR